MASKVSKQPEPGRHDSNAVIMAHHKKPRLQARAIVSISYNEKGFGQTEAIRAYRAGAISEHPPWVHPKAPSEVQILTGAPLIFRHGRFSGVSQMGRKHRNRRFANRLLTELC